MRLHEGIVSSINTSAAYNRTYKDEYFDTVDMAGQTLGLDAKDMKIVQKSLNKSYSDALNNTWDHG